MLCRRATDVRVARTAACVPFEDTWDSMPVGRQSRPRRGTARPTATAAVVRRSRRLSFWDGVGDAEISPGANTANVTGSIAPLASPGSSTYQSGPASFSLVFQGVIFNVAFDILPAAKPFVVAVVAESASAMYRIDPAARTYEIATVVPPVISRAGDFSQAGVTVYKIDDTSGANCAPVPGNVIPGSKIDPADKAAWSAIAVPDVPDSAGIGAGYVRSSGSLRSSSPSGESGPDDRPQ
jgi:hypothetical protein